MRSFTIALLAATWASSVSAQTYSQCNPLTSGSCPPDTALGKKVTVDFTSGSSDSFTPQGNPTYNSNGAGFTVAKSGDSPQLTSKWYIMFGHVEFVVKAAPGAGIVSSAVLQSDDLDEIDWEWLGGDDQQVQSNFYGKGLTTNYNRGAFHPAPGNHDGYNTYTIDWTADQVVWQINGKTVRALTAANTNGYPYPQTPMVVKVGAWSGGDSANPPGTVQWAGGPTNYASGPYTMYVKSIAVTDYSTGSQYTYSGTAGTWQSINAVGGKVNSQGGSGTAQEAAAAPSVTASSNSAPMPFSGSHKDSSSAVQPNAGNWSPTTLQTSGSSATATTYPGLPSGWTVTSSGKVLPPSAAPVTSPPASPSSSPAGSQPGSPVPAGYEVVTTYNQQGFPVAVTQPVGAASAPKHYNDQGFLITTSQAVAARSTQQPVAEKDSVSMSSAIMAAAQSASSSSVAAGTSPSASKVSPSGSGAAPRASGLGMTLSAVFAAVFEVLFL